LQIPDRAKLSRVVLMLAAFVFFSANTVHFIEHPDTTALAAIDPTLHFELVEVDGKKPYLNVKSAILVNYDRGEVLYAKNIDKVRPVASITKMVMVMVLIDKGVDLEVTETILKEDARRSSRSRLRVGYELNLRDLLYAALLNSDNRAARALARATSGSIEAFTSEMNAKVRALGLENTRFFEPTGLDKRNVSTAREVAKIMHYAIEYPLIAEITSTKNWRCRVINRKNTHLQMANTNLMMYSRFSVVSGKTGYIRAADYCLATVLRNSDGERITLVVLGVPGDKLRFREARRLAEWGFKKIA